MGCGYFNRARSLVVGTAADLPAKAVLLNMKQYNGYHGCSYCTQYGEQVEPGKSQIVFPFDPMVRSYARTPEHFRDGFAEAELIEPGTDLALGFKVSISKRQRL